LYIEKKF